MKKFLIVVAVLFALVPASIAKAHDPIILTSDQSTPSDGPLLLDGTISFALYGSLDSAGETRGFRVKFNAGDPLYLSILIPDLAPENLLDDASLPFLNVEDPSGAILNFATTEKFRLPSRTAAQTMFASPSFAPLQLPELTQSLLLVIRQHASPCRLAKKKCSVRPSKTSRTVNSALLA